MPPQRRNRADDSKTRTALLDAAEQVMLEDGYAAVTSRRVANRAGVDATNIYYYFGTMDDLFIALFRRNAERSLERQTEILSSPQPLWNLWASVRDQFDTPLLMEFNALANHRKAVRTEITSFSGRFREYQIEELTAVLKDYGVDLDEWPASSVILLLTSVSRFLLLEEAFGITLGHHDLIRLVEEHIRRLEGEREIPSG